MAPNPIMIPRKRLAQETEVPQSQEAPTSTNSTIPLLTTSVAVLLILTVGWARRWLWSGCAIESLIILSGSHYGTRVFPFIPLWTVLATLNLVYAVCATSWLLYGMFAATCYPSILLTCLFQFEFAGDFARKSLRKWLRQLQFTKDKIALFNLPALEIDTDVNGLFVVRGITISLSSLTIVAHGIELGTPRPVITAFNTPLTLQTGLKLADDMELAMHADQVTIPLFRRIEIGDVYGNLKGGKPEMTFGELGDDNSDAASEDVFLGDTPLLRAATAGSEGFKDRPKLRESLTGVSWIKDSSAQAGFDFVKTLSPDDTAAEKQYLENLTEIRTTSPVYQSRQQVLQRNRIDENFDPDDDKSMRAAICAELHAVPSIIHPPQRSVRVTTLQKLSKPAVRAFLHRLPFLLRLLLMPLSYFHPMTIRSVNAAGSGVWLTALLQQKVFKHYAANNAELRRLARKVSAWLADANFCLELTDIEGLGQVPLSTGYDITTHLRFADIMAYRTEPLSNTIAQVVRLGGADATITIPSFLLPHHEHILPSKPTRADEAKQSEEVEHADGLPKTIQAEHQLEQLQKDETNVKISVHGSLPACFDQSLLNFIAALVKATKIIELEKAADEIEKADDPTSPVLSDDASIHSTMSADVPVARTDSARTDSGFKSFTKNLRQGLKDGSTREAIKEFAKDVHQSTKDNTGRMKRAVVGGMINDRWIAKMVGKIAAKLEQAQGDLGYSGEIPVALEPYRARAELPSKLLP